MVQVDDSGAGVVGQAGSGFSGSLNLYNGRFRTGERFDTGELSRGYQRILNRPHTAAVLLLYPDGSAELSGCHRFSRIGTGEGQQSSWLEKLQRAQNRARVKLHQLCRFNGVQYLGTLTRRGGIQSYSEAQRLWKKFCRQARRHYPNFGAVAVPEFHLGGGVNHGTLHIHFAVSEFYDVNLLRSAWLKCVGVTADGLSMGSINLKAPGKFQGAAHIANYLTGYITKEIFGERAEKLLDEAVRSRYQHYYWVTRNFSPPDLNRPKNKAQKFGYRSMVDYGRSPAERESRLLGWVFALTGRIATQKYRSEDGNHFRFATLSGPGSTVTLRGVPGSTSASRGPVREKVQHNQEVLRL